MKDPHVKENLQIALESTLAEAARKKAIEDRRTLSGYIEHLVKRDLAKKGSAVLSVTAPSDIRRYVPVSFEGESDDLVNQRDKVMDALLKASGR